MHRQLRNVWVTIKIIEIFPHRLRAFAHLFPLSALHRVTPFSRAAVGQGGEGIKPPRNSSRHCWVPAAIVADNLIISHLIINLETVEEWFTRATNEQMEKI